MLRLLTFLLVFLSACAPQAERPELPQSKATGADPAPSETASDTPITQAEIEKIVQQQAVQNPSSQTLDDAADETLRQQVAGRVASIRTRDGSALSPTVQSQATDRVMTLVSASRSRDVLGMTTAAQALTQILSQASGPAFKLVDGAGLAQAIQDLVAAAMNADVAGILAAVEDIVAAATA
jgi:hypothetical protein